MTIQLQACIEDAASRSDGIQPAQPHETPSFFGVYEGEPGAYEWVADFNLYMGAFEYAQGLAVAKGTNLDNKVCEAHKQP